MLSTPQYLSPQGLAINGPAINGYFCAVIANGAGRQERPGSESMTNDKRCVLAWM